MDPDSRNVKTSIDQKNANNQFFPTSMRRPDMQGVRITWYTEAILLRRSKAIVFYNGFLLYLWNCCVVQWFLRLIHQIVV